MPQIVQGSLVCPSCGAPIVPPDGATHVACAYCKNEVAVVDIQRTIAKAAKAGLVGAGLMVALTVGGVVVFAAGLIGFSCWMHRTTTDAVNDTQRRAMRQACAMRCPHECQIREGKAQDRIGPCIDACQTRCASAP